jgi:glyoxylase-like metal-dependent hydrolase (beta-lactamase superfamily II)
MIHFICTACGTQFAAHREPPERCPICQDSRQFVPPAGQSWTTLSELQLKHRNMFHTYEPSVLGIGTSPAFAIDQRALLIRRASGNILWDCIPLIDEATRTIVAGLGGIKAVAISHPHYYSSMIEWSNAFGAVPIYIHEAERDWVMRPDPAIEFWRGETKVIGPGLTLIRCGGHFEGGQVLHDANLASGHGALFTGDIIAVVADRNWVSFMYSYPNLIPLPAQNVIEIGARLGPFDFDRIYGAFWERVVEADGKKVLERSVARYLERITGDRAKRKF